MHYSNFLENGKLQFHGFIPGPSLRSVSRWTSDIVIHAGWNSALVQHCLTQMQEDNICHYGLCFDGIYIHQGLSLYIC